MGIEKLSPRVTYCGGNECDVDLPNEFITVHFRRRATGRITHKAERWSSDSLSRPSRRALQEAKTLAAQAFTEKGGDSPVPKRKRDWKRIKGFRDALPRIPVIYRGSHEGADGRVVAECILIHGKRKFCFWCSQPLEEKTSWRAVHGMIVDDRMIPELPRGFEKLRPLLKPGKSISHQAKQVAFAVLREVRSKEHFRRTQPSLFPED